MTVINTRLIVAANGAISAATPLPAGEHAAAITVNELPVRQLPALPFDIDALPTLDLGPWPAEAGLRREDMYGDDGR